MNFWDQIWGMWAKNMVNASSRIFKQWRRDIRAGGTPLWCMTTSGVWFEMTIKFTKENHVLAFTFDWFQNCLHWLSACCAHVRYIWMIYDIQFAKWWSLWWKISTKNWLVEYVNEHKCAMLWEIYFFIFWANRWC